MEPVDPIVQDQLINRAVEHAHAHHDTYLSRFMDFLRIESVSTNPSYQAGIDQAAEFVRAELERLGFDQCAILPTEGHPVVYGEWLRAGADKPTVLVYAHYDVQPPDPFDLWESGPFDPTIRDGKLYARGAADDKTGIWGNLKAFESLLETTGALPVNVKVMFEGEEEMGSPHLEPFVQSEKERLAADLFIASDEGYPPGQPLNTYSARGIVAAEVTVTGPENDLHSGQYGGCVRNPLHAAAQIIASFHDDNGHILIPGAYEGAIPLSEDERTLFSGLEPEIIAISKQSSGNFEPWGEPGFGFVERASARPTLDVSGMYGGYQGQGGKTIIPARAGFKVTMRLAPGQNPDIIAQRLVDHVMAFNSDTAAVNIDVLVKAWPALLLRKGPVIDALNRAFEAVWGKPMRPDRSGGTLPILGMVQQELGVPMTGLGMSVGGFAHAPNEYIDVDSFQTCIDTAIHFYVNLGQRGKAEIG